MTDALPFPGLAGGLVRPGDVLVRLEDPRKAPSDVDVTEASFVFIEKVVAGADAARGGDGDVREVGGGRRRGGGVSGDEVLMASPRARWKQRTTPRDLGFA